MHSRPTPVLLRLPASQAETIYFELLGLLAHYRDSKTNLEPSDECALLSAVTQLELGIERSQRVAEVQLEQLRAAALRTEVA